MSNDSTLSPAAVDSLLEVSAVDLGTPGKDNAYGAGRIDVLAAVTGVADRKGPAARASQLTAFPNPFRGVCHFGTGVPVEVLDAAGRRIAVVLGGTWRPAAGLEPGVYFVRQRSAVSGERKAVRVTYVR
jgi:hypothetical protein